jgi:hypothetical protein
MAGWLGRPELLDVPNHVRDTLDRYCIQAFLSRFSRPVSGFPLTYHIELIDEVSIVFSVGEEALISFRQSRDRLQSPPRDIPPIPNVRFKSYMGPSSLQASNPKALAGFSRFLLTSPLNTEQKDLKRGMLKLSWTGPGLRSLSSLQLEQLRCYLTVIAEHSLSFSTKDLVQKCDITISKKGILR